MLLFCLSSDQFYCHMVSFLWLLSVQNMCEKQKQFFCLFLSRLSHAICFTLWDYFPLWPATGSVIKTLMGRGWSQNTIFSLSSNWRTGPDKAILMHSPPLHERVSFFFCLERCYSAFLIISAIKYDCRLFTFTPIIMLQLHIGRKM